MCPTRATRLSCGRFVEPSRVAWPAPRTSHDRPGLPTGRRRLSDTTPTIVDASLRTGNAESVARQRSRAGDFAERPLHGVRVAFDRTIGGVRDDVSHSWRSGAHFNRGSPLPSLEPKRRPGLLPVRADIGDDPQSSRYPCVAPIDASTGGRRAPPVRLFDAAARGLVLSTFAQRGYNWRLTARASSPKPVASSALPASA